MKTAIQELFSQLEIEHPALFNTNTLKGRQFVNDYYKFFELEKQQIINAWELEGNEYVKNGKDYYEATFKIETK
jgi:hypothetical protein